MPWTEKQWQAHDEEIEELRAIDEAWERDAKLGAAMREPLRLWAAAYVEHLGSPTHRQNRELYFALHDALEKEADGE